VQISGVTSPAADPSVAEPPHTLQQPPVAWLSMAVGWGRAPGPAVLKSGVGSGCRRLLVVRCPGVRQDPDSRPGPDPGADQHQHRGRHAPPRARRPRLSPSGGLFQFWPRASSSSSPAGCGSAGRPGAARRLNPAAPPDLLRPAATRRSTSFDGQCVVGLRAAAMLTSTGTRPGSSWPRCRTPPPPCSPSSTLRDEQKFSWALRAVSSADQLSEVHGTPNFSRWRNGSRPG
jgi:hypothetical protein